jgi:alkylhydroperoxidase family enzyme
MAWIRTIDKEQAEGELRLVYDAMASRPIPLAYIPPHGGAPGIHRAHSLDAALLQRVFAVTGVLHRAGELTWTERELLSTVASRTNQCLY